MKHVPTLLSVALSLCLVSAALDAQHNPPPGLYSIASPDGTVSLTYRLKPTLQSPGLTLVSISQQGKTFALVETDLWSLRLRTGSGSLVPETLNATDGLLPSQATSFGSNHFRFASSFIQNWTNVSFAGISDLFKVTVTGAAANGSTGRPGQVNLTISVTDTTQSPSCSIFSVVFPRIGIQEVSGNDQFLVIPDFGGKLVPNPMTNAELPLMPSEPGMSHPGRLSMQFFSYYVGGSSTSPRLYFGTEDKVGDFKDFHLERAPGTAHQLFVRLRRWPPSNLTATTFSPGYAFVLSVQNGDWYDAARFYRGWATGAGVPWTAQGPMTSDTTFPEVLKAMRMFLFTNPSACCVSISPPCDPLPPNVDYTNLLDWPAHVAEHSSFFELSDLFTRIHSWDRKSWDGKQWGIWLPPRAEFVTAASQLQSAPYHSFQAYYNAELFNVPIVSSGPPVTYPPPSDPVYGAAISAAALDRDLTFVVSPDGATDYDLTGPCGTQPTALGPTSDNLVIDQRSSFVFDQIRSTLLDDSSHANHSLKELGVKGLYLDAFAQARPQLSYNTSSTMQGFPPGGGSGWTEGRLKTLQRLSTDAALVDSGGHPFFYTSEGFQEVFLKYIRMTAPTPLDLLFHERFVAGDPSTPGEWIVPLFQTVYHDYHVASTPLQADGPRELDSVLDYRRLRIAYAAQLSCGYALFGGSALTHDSVDGSVFISTLRGMSANYTQYTDMIKNFASILRLDEVRAFTTFGERRRDPVCPGRKTMVETGRVWVPEGQNQPFVYVAAFENVQTGQRPSLGVLLLNWSQSQCASAPNCPPVDAADAGDQIIDVVIAPSDYELTGNYEVSEIQTNPDATAHIVPVLTFDAGGGPLTLDDIAVPQLSARFYRLTPVP